MRVAALVVATALAFATFAFATCTFGLVGIMPVSTFVVATAFAFTTFALAACTFFSSEGKCGEGRCQAGYVLDKVLRRSVETAAESRHRDAAWKSRDSRQGRQYRTISMRADYTEGTTLLPAAF